MVNLSDNYKNNIRKSDSSFSFGEQIRNEIIVAYLLDYCHIIKGDYILGIENSSVPDLVSSDREYGYEITQSELTEDLEMKYVSSALEKCDYKEQETKQFLEENKITHPANSDEYNFYKNKKGNVGGFGPRPCPRSPYYYIPVFENNLKKKLDKLVDGNYKNSKRTALVVSIYDRCKEYDDALKIFECFVKAQEKRERKFFNLYLITSTAIYFISKNNSLDFIDISGDPWKICIEKANQLIKQFSTNK